MANDEQTSAKRAKDWQPPRGITLVHFPKRPNQPYGVQWRLDGKRKTRTFATKERQVAFAKDLAGDAKENGTAAFKLDEQEARRWRAFIAQVGEGADLDAVARCWLKHRADVERPALTLAEAVEIYTKAKEAEKVSKSVISHWDKIFTDYFFSVIPPSRDVADVTKAEIATFISAQADAAPNTQKTRFKCVRGLFNWLAETDRLASSPFRGMKPPKVPHKEVEILTVKQTRDLFEKNAKGKKITHERRETLGRLALEAFAGLRNDTAAQIVASEIEADGLRIPAAKIKTAQPQFLDGLPANLHAWLKWSQPSKWTMTRRQYLKQKENAFVRAEVPHPHNCLRHGFASYHVAAFKDPSKTSVIMCHTSTKLLWNVYRGIATEADGKAYFEIMPPS